MDIRGYIRRTKPPKHGGDCMIPREKALSQKCPFPTNLINALSYALQVHRLLNQLVVVRILLTCIQKSLQANANTLMRIKTLMSVSTI